MVIGYPYRTRKQRDSGPLLSLDYSITERPLALISQPNEVLPPPHLAGLIFLVSAILSLSACDSSQLAVAPVQANHHSLAADAFIRVITERPDLSEQLAADPHDPSVRKAVLDAMTPEERSIVQESSVSLTSLGKIAEDDESELLSRVSACGDLCIDIGFGSCLRALEAELTTDPEAEEIATYYVASLRAVHETVLLNPVSIEDSLYANNGRGVVGYGPGRVTADLMMAPDCEYAPGHVPTYSGCWNAGHATAATTACMVGFGGAGALLGGPAGFFVGSVAGGAGCYWGYNRNVQRDFTGAANTWCHQQIDYKPNERHKQADNLCSSTGARMDRFNKLHGRDNMG